MITTDEALAILDDIAPSRRPGQQAMLRGAMGVLEHGMHAAIVAPTGTGKSFVNLVAGAAASGRTVISTGTLLLQRQYSVEDVPPVVAAFQRAGHEVAVAIIKGRRNYGCVAAAEGILADGADQLLPLEVSDEVERAARWVVRGEGHGDWSAAPFEATSAIREALTVDSDSCLGKRCPSFDECHFEWAKTKADQAKIVLCNHAYFVANAVTGGNLLGEHDNVIIDEAHKLEGFAVGAFASTVSFGRTARDRESGTLVRLGQLLSRVDVIDGGMLASDLTATSGQLRLAIDALIGRRKGDVMLPGALQHETIGPLLADLRVTLVAVERLLLDRYPDADAPTSLIIPWRKAASSVEAIRMLLHSLAVDTPGTVSYMSRDRNAVSLNAADVDVGKYLRPLSWLRPDGTRRGVILTSATIPAGFGERMGLDDPQYGAVPSPFNLPDAMVAYVADDLPPATFKWREKWEPHALARAAEIADAALQVGGVLVLCTSLAQAATFGRHLAPLASAARGVTLVVDDGETDKDVILDRLQRADRPLFIGSRGFYEGLNLPRKLRAVIVPSLPWAVPGDPIGEARRALWPCDDWTHPIDLAETVCAIEQIAGRLIRCGDDRGIVAFLDRRMLHGGDAAVLQTALPEGVRIFDHQWGASVLQWLLDTRAAAA